MGKMKILIIEDKRKTFNFYKKWLERFNYSVLPQNFTEMGKAIDSNIDGTIWDFAIQQIKDNYNDLRLVICDIQLGGDPYAGETVVKKIREIKDLNPSYVSMLPIIGLTHYPDRQKAILDAGADYPIEKNRIHYIDEEATDEETADEEPTDEVNDDLNNNQYVFYAIIKRNVEKFDNYLQQMHIVKKNNKKVFIVHGQDHYIREQVENTLRQMGFEPIVLFKEASMGKSIFEKIEYYSNECCYSIILYTKCDEGRRKGTEEWKDRARQNVVFEHGYMCAKIGIDHVCALVEEGIEMPSDLSGIVYIPNDRSNNQWRFDIAKEMRAAGLDADSNKIK